MRCAGEGRRGERDGAIPVMREAVDDLHRPDGSGWRWGIGVLVETLLQGGAEGDLAEAKEQIDWLANLGPINGSAMLISHCCGCARYWPGPAAMTSPTGTW